MDENLQPADSDDVVVKPVKSKKSGVADIEILARFLASERSDAVLKFDATDIVYGTVLFVILQLPIVDDMLEKFLPITKSLVVRTALKAVAFFVILFVLVKIRHNRAKKSKR